MSLPRWSWLMFMLPLAAETVSWTRFRGPNGAGVAQSPAPPSEFSKEKNLVWRTELPPGYSSPVLGNKCVYVSAHEGTKLYAMCVSRADGSVLWKNEVGEVKGKRLPVNTPVSASAVTDGKMAWFFFEHAGLVAYDELGKLKWKLELGPFNNPYGMAASPILVDGVVVLQADQDTGSFLLGVDAKTGRQLWKVERTDAQHGFATPAVYQPKGKQPAQVIVSGSYQVAAYSAKNGEKLWWVDGMAWQAKSVPVVAGDRLFVHSWMAGMNELVKLPDLPWEKFAAEYDKDKDGAISREEAPEKGMVGLWFLFDIDRSGKIERQDFKIIEARTKAQSGLFAIQLGGTGDLTKTAVQWRVDKGLPNIPSPLFYQDVLYVLKEGGILTSYDPKTGSVAKQGRVEGAVDAYFASPVAAGGRIFTAAKDGKIGVLKAGAQWEVEKVNDLGEETWATPAIEGGRLYVRTQSALYCFGAKAGA